MDMGVPDLGEYRDRDWPAAQKAHAAMVTRLDRDVGRLLDLVRELGLEEKTLVLFSSDNGPHREGGFDPAARGSSGPLRGLKRDLYEGGFKQAILEGDWKGICLAPGRPLELYDLATDPGETRDLAAEGPEVVARLEQLLPDARTDSPDWRPAGEARLGPAGRVAGDRCGRRREVDT